MSAFLLGAAVSAYSATRPTRDGQGLVRIYAVTTGVRSDDVGAAGRSAGDRLFRGMELRDRGGGLIGTATQICTYMGGATASPISQCSMTFMLPRGRIVAMGSRQRRDYYVLAVVGGTGVYSQARGVLIASTFSSYPTRRERMLFSLEP